MTPKQPESELSLEKDFIAKIACNFMGYGLLDYWKRAALEQHPEATDAAKQINIENQLKDKQRTRLDEYINQYKEKI